ncbi:MAG: DNA-binding protein [Spirochaetales bacterium]|nr:DNA-binding protein [Spirochaetales bacterium]
MNPMDLIKNFQNIQSRVGEMQEKLKEVTVSGTSGGDMVRIEMNGQMEVTKVSISPEAVDPEDIGMLEDLVFAAFSDAFAKIKEKMREEMSAITGGMNLPPGILGM